jgi:hypothetical protein
MIVMERFGTILSLCLIMENMRIILIFLGIASAIVIFTFQRAGVMEGENVFIAALKQQQSSDSLFQAEKKELIRTIDSAIASIEFEVVNLVGKKNLDGPNIEKQDIDKQINILNLNKAYLHYKKGEIVNAYQESWNGLKKEADSLLQKPVMIQSS